MEETSRCWCCGGVVEKEPLWVEAYNYRYTSPFYCLCCGREICGNQFSYGAACAWCDMGKCNRETDEPTHEHPSWWERYGFDSKKATWDRFAEFAGATLVERD